MICYLVIFVRWECNPTWTVRLPAQGPDVRLRVPGWTSLSTTLRCLQRERWGMSRHRQLYSRSRLTHWHKQGSLGSACVGSSQLHSKLRAVWAACQLPSHSDWQKFPVAKKSSNLTQWLQKRASSQLSPDTRQETAILFRVLVKTLHFSCVQMLYRAVF